jgi:class 3 adenylate cyclase/tetratricopeptide (TPR) repeat protein
MLRARGHTMICPQCKSENSLVAAFCDQCGARLEEPCPHCGEPNREGAKFCRGCGQPLTKPEPSPAPPTPQSPTPDSYVPKHLAEKILASRHKLEGERKQVTVLFADIRESTKLVEPLDPEDAQKLIDPVLDIMMEAVHRYEGTVNQVTGDGIMALFGAPLAHEDHALRACYAALAMQEEMQRYRQKLGQTEESGLQIGVGMNSGEVVVRSIDTDLNIDYSAVGHTTHLAARMQEIAGPGLILMSFTTLRQVEGFVQVQSLGPVQVKGISQPLEAYSLTGVTTARTRVQAGAARGLTPLVGRNVEIEIFNKLIQRASAGRGQILAMIGEPGVGKSRLVHEFTHHRLPPGWVILEAASASYGKATPYYPVIQMLRRYFGIRAGEASEYIRSQVVQRIVELDPNLKDTIAPILSLLGALPAGDANWLDAEFKLLESAPDISEWIHRFVSMDLEQRRRHTLDSLKRMCIRESQRQNLLLVFEDLHWIDHETQAFLDVLVDSIPMARFMLLVDFRPEYNQHWSDKSFYTQLRIDPLPASEAEELLSKLLGNNPDLGPLKQLLAQRTEGNPFFAEETVRSLAETGVLAGEKGAYRPAVRIDDLMIPSSVQTVVAERIDRLPAEEKHFLQTAAVIGVIVPFDLLQAVSQLPDEKLFQYLSHLKSAEFIYETNLFPKLEYTFKHALTNEVAYGMLLRERRCYLHERILNAVEKMAGNAAYEYLETLAYHSLRGEIWNKAVVYLKDAGIKAVSRSGFRQALDYFEQALDALRRLPHAQSNFRHAVDVRIEMRHALFFLGDFDQALRYLQEARDLAATLNDEGRLGQVFNLMTAHWNLTGNSQEAIASARQAIQHTKAREHLDLHIVAHYFLGVAHHNLGQYDGAIDPLQRALSLIGSRKYELFGTTGIVSVICKAWLARCLGQTGKFHDAISHGEQAVETALERNHGYSIAYGYYALGLVWLIKGDFDNALGVLERGLKTCAVADIPVQRPLISSCLGAAYVSSGRLDKGLELLAPAVEHTASMRRLGGQALRMAWLTDAYVLAGRKEEARTLALRGVELARENKDRGSEAWVLRTLGDVAAQDSVSNLHDAAAHYGEALGLAQELGMHPLQAHCRFGMGDLYRRTGEIEKARSELLSASELYRQMSMNFWLSKAQRSLSEMRPIS